jgi:hypothetical protein
MRRLVALSGEEKKARAAGCDDCVPEPLQPTQLLVPPENHIRV